MSQTSMFNYLTTDNSSKMIAWETLQWRHNDHDGVSNHQPHGCLLNRLFRDQRKHQSSASLAFVWGIHRNRWIPRTNSQLRGKCFHLMTSSCMSYYIPYKSTGLSVTLWSLPDTVPHLHRQKISFHYTLQWRHNGRDGVSNHQPHDCLRNRLIGRRSRKTSKLLVTGLCAGNSPGTGEFPAQRSSNAENVSIWWRHYETAILVMIKLSCVLILETYWFHLETTRHPHAAHFQTSCHDRCSRDAVQTAFKMLFKVCGYVGNG